jgi:transcriptional regulator with XRE-family HTH domain
VSLAREQKHFLSKLGANIRRERSARGITQEQLAELADLNIRTVQKIEGGELNVLITTLVRIQRGLTCKWDRLVSL